MADHDYKNGGLRHKYNISKNNGDPIDDDAIYFVLRIDKDPHARKALSEYAKSIVFENEILAHDLFMLVEMYKQTGE